MTSISREGQGVKESTQGIATTKSSSNSSSSSSDKKPQLSTTNSNVITKKSKKNQRSTKEMILRYLALAFFAAGIFWFNRKCGTFFKWIGSSFKASREAKKMNYMTAIIREEAIRAWIAESSAKQH